MSILQPFEKITQVYTYDKLIYNESEVMGLGHITMDMPYLFGTKTMPKFELVGNIFKHETVSMVLGGQCPPLRTKIAL